MFHAPKELYFSPSSDFLVHKHHPHILFKRSRIFGENLRVESANMVRKVVTNLSSDRFAPWEIMDKVEVSRLSTWKTRGLSSWTIVFFGIEGMSKISERHCTSVTSKDICSGSADRIITVDRDECGL